MEQINQILDYEFMPLLIAALAIVWLVWLPKLIAPRIAPYYSQLPIWVKLSLNTLMPTIEQAVRTVWAGFAHEMMERAKQTETPIDDELWEKADEIARGLIDKIDE